jgi:hypothetical protein
MRFILVSTFFMAWVFYEMSGGSDFVPASQRDTGLVASAEASDIPAAQAAKAEADTTANEPIATRSAASPAVDGLIFATMKPAAASDQAELLNASATAEPRNVGEGSLKVIALPGTVKPQPASAPAAQATVEKAAVFAAPEMRRVAGSSVNMRNGPGTSYDVLDRLGEGDLVEVLQDTGDGWVKLRVEDTGRIGWMADFLLASAE